MPAACVVAAAAIALAALATMLAARLRRRVAARAERRRELHEVLEVSASQSESEQLLIRHVQRIAPGCAAAVLRGDEAEDRLSVTLSGPAAGGPLSDARTDPLRRRSCLAIRLGRGYDRRAGGDPLGACEVCGGVTGEVVCQPLRAGGRVLGSVLVAHERSLGADKQDELRESVAQAAPILAHQRTLEHSEQHVAFDSLTGLPNRRAAEETLRRMAAHAGRALNPLSALLVDLDRFTEVNERHGQGHGDRALAIIGQVLAATLRASDYAARSEGDAFLVALADTDRRGATEVAEKVRYAVAHAELPVVGGLTCSIGVAALPEDAVDPDELIRKAERALYAAKVRGRNRVHTAAPIPAAKDRVDEDDDLFGPGDLMGT